MTDSSFLGNNEDEDKDLFGDTDVQTDVSNSLVGWGEDHLVNIYSVGVKFIQTGAVPEASASALVNNLQTRYDMSDLRHPKLICHLMIISGQACAQAYKVKSFTETSEGFHQLIDDLKTSPTAYDDLIAHAETYNTSKNTNFLNTFAETVQASTLSRTKFLGLLDGLSESFDLGLITADFYLEMNAFFMRSIIERCDSVDIDIVFGEGFDFKDYHPVLIYSAIKRYLDTKLLSNPEIFS